MNEISVTDKVPQPIQKLLAVFTVNTITSLIKDKIYTQHLNPHKPVEHFPASSLALLFTRDLLAMAAAFVLPSMAAKFVSEKYGYGFANS